MELDLEEDTTSKEEDMFWLTQIWWINKYLYTSLSLQDNDFNFYIDSNNNNLNGQLLSDKDTFIKAIFTPQQPYVITDISRFFGEIRIQESSGPRSQEHSVKYHYINQ